MPIKKFVPRIFLTAPIKKFIPSIFSRHANQNGRIGGRHELNGFLDEKTD
jgi:hypothetical protein